MQSERSFSPATLTPGIFRIRQGNEPRRVTIDSNPDYKRQSRVVSATRHTPTSYGGKLRRPTLTRLEELLKASIGSNRGSYSATIRSTHSTDSSSSINPE